MAVDIKTAAIFVLLNLLVVVPLIYFIAPQQQARLVNEDRSTQDNQEFHQLLAMLDVKTATEARNKLSQLKEGGTQSHDSTPKSAEQSEHIGEQKQLQDLLAALGVQTAPEAQAKISHLRADSAKLGAATKHETHGDQTSLESQQLQQLFADIGVQSTAEAHLKLSQWTAERAHAQASKGEVQEGSLLLRNIFGAEAIDAHSKIRRDWWHEILPKIETAFNKGHPKFPYNPKGGHESTEPASCCGYRTYGWTDPSKITDRFQFLGPIGPPCPRELEHFGSSHEEKRSCAFKEIQAKEACHVISIGSNNEWKFEEAMFAQANCVVHVFDCTGPGTWKPPAAISSRTYFYDICIGVKDDGKFLTWNSMLKRAGLSKSPAYLKIDVEGFEWSIFPPLFLQSSDHLLPHQIAVEIHHETRMKPLRWKGRFRALGEFALFGELIWRTGYNIIDRNAKEFLLARLRPRSLG